jgi:hypothetical protein
MAMTISGEELMRRRAEGKCITCGWSNVKPGRDGELEYECDGCKKQKRDAKDRQGKK